MKPYILALLLIAPLTLGALELDNIQFDPAIIAAGDEVDIVIEYHDESIVNDPRLGNTAYTFRVDLQADDRLTRDYVTIQDDRGDDVRGTIFAQGHYNKRFTVKVNTDAPAGTYEFKLVGQWYKNGEPTGAKRFIRFDMPVKREGIILDIADISTAPVEVRPGHDFVTLTTRVENVGQKDAKAATVTLDLPAQLEHSYTDANRKWIGRVNSGEAKQATFTVDVNDDAPPGMYNITYVMHYLDVDDNNYTKQRRVPFLVKPRPYLEVTSTGSGTAGGAGTMTVTVTNTGQEDAEAVDVRILKQSTQPFSFDVRSEYIGELRPGESGKARFEADVGRDADQRNHTFKLLLRAKGDSDEGDDTVYTFNRRASMTVAGNAPNYYLYAGSAAAIIIILGGLRWKRSE